MTLDFPQVALETDDSVLIVRSEVPLVTLSSAVVGGGFGRVHAVVNRHVNKGYDCDDPARDLREFALKRGIVGEFVGLLTAVWMRKARTLTVREGDLTVSALITARVSNACAAGLSQPQHVEPGTINIMVFVDGKLSQGAMVNAIKTISEAETSVLHARGIKTAEGYPATGTSTDAIVVACTGRGTELPYAGPLTPVGFLIARCVRACLEMALDAD
jgi:iron complex transport system ATP-binding protein